MQGLDEIVRSNGIDLGSLAARFGLSLDQTRSAMGSLVPAVVGGFHKQAEAGDPAGVADAANAVEQPDEQSGNDILGRIFGSKDVSRQVADHAAGQSGVSSTILQSMLPIVAAMVARHVATSGSGLGGGGLGGTLASVLGGGNAETAGGSGRLGGGLGGLGSLLGGGSHPLGESLAVLGCETHYSAAIQITGLERRQAAMKRPSRRFIANVGNGLTGLTATERTGSGAGNVISLAAVVERPSVDRW